LTNPHLQNRIRFLGQNGLGTKMTIPQSKGIFDQRLNPLRKVENLKFATICAGISQQLAQYIVPIFQKMTFRRGLTLGEIAACGRCLWRRWRQMPTQDNARESAFMGRGWCVEHLGQRRLPMCGLTKV